MKLALALSIIFLCSLNLVAQCGVKCGSERWVVKTASDPTINQLVLKPKTRTIHWLRTQAPPQSKSDVRTQGLEKENIRVRSRLVGYKKETEDHDFHVVLADPTTGETMIVEFPDVACSGVCASTLRPDIVKARNDFLASAPVKKRGKPTTKYKELEETAFVEVIGPGFWDFSHHQTGRAPNDIEIHPVIWFRVCKKATGKCQ
jgi:hypothetical protein